MFNISFRDKKFKIVEKFGIFVLISLVIILAGAIDMFAVRGMNFGIEFSGGINVEVEARGAENLEDTVTAWLSDNGYVLGGAIQKAGAGLSFRVNSELKDGTDLNTTVEGAEQTLLVDHSNKISGEGAENYSGSLKAHLEEKYPSIEVEVTTHVIGNDVKNYTVKNALIAVSVAVVVILAYIAIRFTFLAGVSAIIALLHDVLVMFALTTIFQIPVNMTFIAAVITIIGYSINATIVVFDRIRELNALPSNL
jgi:preprotein translocase SecF subunit